MFESQRTKQELSQAIDLATSASERSKSIRQSLRKVRERIYNLENGQRRLTNSIHMQGEAGLLLVDTIRKNREKTERLLDNLNDRIAILENAQRTQEQNDLATVQLGVATTERINDLTMDLHSIGEIAAIAALGVAQLQGRDTTELQAILDTIQADGQSLRRYRDDVQGDLDMIKGTTAIVEHHLNGTDSGYSPDEEAAIIQASNQAVRDRLASYQQAADQAREQETDPVVEPTEAERNTWYWSPDSERDLSGIESAMQGLKDTDKEGFPDNEGILIFRDLPGIYFGLLAKNIAHDEDGGATALAVMVDKEHATPWALSRINNYQQDVVAHAVVNGLVFDDVSDATLASGQGVDEVRALAERSQGRFVRIQRNTQLVNATQNAPRN